MLMHTHTRIHIQTHKAQSFSVRVITMFVIHLVLSACQFGQYPSTDSTWLLCATVMLIHRDRQRVPLLLNHLVLRIQVCWNVMCRSVIGRMHLALPDP